MSAEPGSNLGPCGRKAEILQLRKPCPPNLTSRYESVRRPLTNISLHVESFQGLTELEETVATTISNDGRLLDSIALKLDSVPCRIYNWIDLGNELGIARDVLKQFALSVQSPTKMLFRVLKAKKPQLKVHDLRMHLSQMKRNDVLVIFDRYLIEGNVPSKVYSC